jgi:D-alanine-D-alanine ligase
MVNIVNLKLRRIAVIMGGTSAEREVSLRTGAAVLDALLASGYNAVGIDSAQELTTQLLELDIEIAVVAVHGRYGEDGTLQGLLEIMHIPYTGSGVLASALAINKAVTKQMVAGIVNVAPSFLVDADSDVPALCAQCTSYPQVVKPVREGSTIGISIVNNASELREAISQARTFDQQVLVEAYIGGREVTVSVVNGRALPIIEVVPAEGFYDYAAKYTAGTTQYLVPAPLPEEQSCAVQLSAEKCCAKLGCRGAARVDFIIGNCSAATGDDGVDLGEQIYFLEVNTVPGMTETSLLPKAAASAGIDFASLVELMVQDASLDR